MPSNNKVTIGNTVLMDITDSTITARDVVSGKVAYLADGSRTTGTLQIITYYTGTTDPPSTLGNDGDIYLKVSS